MQTSPSASETVRVMLNQLTIRNLFVDKQNLAQPVKLLNVSPSKDVTCFNTNFIWYLVSGARKMIVDGVVISFVVLKQYNNITALKSFLGPVILQLK